MKIILSALLSLLSLSAHAETPPRADFEVCTKASYNTRKYWTVYGEKHWSCVLPNKDIVCIQSRENDYEAFSMKMGVFRPNGVIKGGDWVGDDNPGIMVNDITVQYGFKTLVPVDWGKRNRHISKYGKHYIVDGFYVVDMKTLTGRVTKVEYRKTGTFEDETSHVLYSLPFKCEEIPPLPSDDE